MSEEISVVHKQQPFEAEKYDDKVQVGAANEFDKVEVGGAKDFDIVPVGEEAEIAK
jgi:hypothetical protein